MPLPGARTRAPRAVGLTVGPRFPRSEGGGRGHRTDGGRPCRGGCREARERGPLLPECSQRPTRCLTSALPPLALGTAPPPRPAPPALAHTLLSGPPLIIGAVGQGRATVDAPLGSWAFCVSGARAWPCPRGPGVCAGIGQLGWGVRAQEAGDRALGVARPQGPGFEGRVAGRRGETAPPGNQGVLAPKKWLCRWK